MSYCCFESVESKFMKGRAINCVVSVMLFCSVALIQMYHRMCHEAVDIPLNVEDRAVAQVLTKLTVEGRGARRQKSEMLMLFKKIEVGRGKGREFKGAVLGWC